MEREYMIETTAAVTLRMRCNSMAWVDVQKAIARINELSNNGAFMHECFELEIAEPENMEATVYDESSGAYSEEVLI